MLLKTAWIICATLVLGTTGCDQINTLKEHILGKSSDDAAKSPAAQTQSTSSGAPIMTPKTLARVGNWTITVDEFQERLNALKEVVPDYDISNIDAKKLVLEELVRQQLLVFDAESAGIAKQKEVLAAVDEFRRTLLVREVARKITEGIAVSEEEAKKFYEERKEQLVQPADYRIREIVVATQVKASELWSGILKGASFEQMAKDNSTSPSAANGGDLGFIKEEPFPEMAKEILALKSGDVSNVFQGPDGFYIIKLEEKKGGEQIPFEEIKDDIIQNQMVLKQQQVILDYIEGLRKKTKIEINEDLLK